MCISASSPSLITAWLKRAKGGMLLSDEFCRVGSSHVLLWPVCPLGITADPKIMQIQYFWGCFPLLPSGCSHLVAKYCAVLWSFSSKMWFVFPGNLLQAREAVSLFWHKTKGIHMLNFCVFEKKNAQFQVCFWVNYLEKEQSASNSVCFFPAAFLLYAFK